MNGYVWSWLDSSLGRARSNRDADGAELELELEVVPIGPMKRLPLSLGQSWQWEERRAVGLATIGPLAEVRRMRELQLLDTCGRRCE
jgi:hypothetical protein